MRLEHTFNSLKFRLEGGEESFLLAGPTQGVTVRPWVEAIKLFVAYLDPVVNESKNLDAPQEFAFYKPYGSLRALCSAIEYSRFDKCYRATETEDYIYIQVPQDKSIYRINKKTGKMPECSDTINFWNRTLCPCENSGSTVNKLNLEPEIQQTRNTKHDKVYFVSRRKEDEAPFYTQTPNSVVVVARTENEAKGVAIANCAAILDSEGLYPVAKEALIVEDITSKLVPGYVLSVGY